MAVRVRSERAVRPSMRWGGRGEAAGVYYMDDRPEGMLATLEGMRDSIEAGIDRESLRALLPPGGARNAVDCALWELESRRAEVPVWQLAGLAPPRPLLESSPEPARPCDRPPRRSSAEWFRCRRCRRCTPPQWPVRRREPSGPQPMPPAIAAATARLRSSSMIESSLSELGVAVSAIALIIHESGG